MVAHNVLGQHCKIETIEATRRVSFSHRDLDYKMKMLQLTLVYRRSVIKDAAPPAHRHSIAQDMFLKPDQYELSHRPKILAFEPKLKVEAPKPPQVMVSLQSATMPKMPQRSKVSRLVSFFEDTGNNTSAPRQPKPATKNHHNPIPKTQARPLIREMKHIPQQPPTEAVEQSPTPEDDAIKAELSRRKRVKELCSFFERQAKH